MLATIMQALDTTIANVALPHMQGSLSATQDQITWVLTSYIVAAAIMTPPTGWLAARFGRKRLFLVRSRGFTLASMLCGAGADRSSEIVLFRLLQGVFGAALVPLSQAVLLDIYPREKHGSAMAIWGVGVMVGPILGPDARRLADRELQLALGVLHQPAVRHPGLPRPARPSCPRRDRRSVAASTGSASRCSASRIGALQLMLDRGEQLDWFGSTEIIAEAVVCRPRASTCSWSTCFTADAPVHRARACSRTATSSTGLVFIFMVGIMLLATLALLPPFLQNLMGYPVLTAGLVLAPRGVGTMLMMFVVGRLIGRVDARLIMATGLALTALSL